jgi:hypothetical protein
VILWRPSTLVSNPSRFRRASKGIRPKHVGR